MSVFKSLGKVWHHARRYFYQRVAQNGIMEKNSASGLIQTSWIYLVCPSEQQQIPAPSKGTPFRRCLAAPIDMFPITWIKNSNVKGVTG